jgi:hypothetical protein
VDLESALEIDLSWKQPVDIGGCSILSYKVEHDDGEAGAFS